MSEDGQDGCGFCGSDQHLSFACGREGELTRGEQRVYDLLVEDLSFAEIGQRLHIHMKSVKFHATHVYRKLGVRSRVALVARYYKKRIAELEQLKTPSQPPAPPPITLTQIRELVNIEAMALRRDA